MRGGLHVFQARYGTSVVHVHQNGNCCRLGHQFTQQFHVLGSQRGTEKAHPGYVAARSAETSDETFPDGIVAGCEYDRLL